MGLVTLVVSSWLWVGVGNAPFAQGSFTNWESPHVHPLELTPDGNLLLAVNTPDAVLEVFAVREGGLTAFDAIPVGLDPVSVRARSNDEVWVVNHISDSVNIVDLRLGIVTATLPTDDEPADVIFTEARAFVSCSQANTILVYELADLSISPQRIELRGEDPRALALSKDGTELYVGVFESGNRSTILAGGARHPSLPDAVGDPDGPYGGVNPPPNNGDNFRPAIAPDLPPPPEVALIVKQDRTGRWRDDNGADWTAYVSGDKADRSGRPEGWRLLDHDLAVIDTRTLDVRYVSGLMNICAALAVHPQSGDLAVVGTDARNEVRFMANLKGRFVRSKVAFVKTNARKRIRDLNPHLGLEVASVAPSEREKSLADPRGIAWGKGGRRAYVSGMGSNNLAVLNSSGQRLLGGEAIEVGAGPTGVVFDTERERIYVLNRFGSSISTVDTEIDEEIARTPFHDATPSAIHAGRALLFDAHANSGTGAVSCASCHVDARMDRLAWDLGEPEGAMREITTENKGAGIFGAGVGDLRQGFEPWHPMKGPMVTQTLQDIIGHEPFHWRGDRKGIEEFAATFVALLGDDAEPDAEAMGRFKAYLATISYPPNPFRSFDHSLAQSVPLPGLLTTGDFGPAGEPLISGDAKAGREFFRSVITDDAYCRSCHSLPSGAGANQVQDQWNLEKYHTLPPDENGNRNHAIFAIGGGGSDNVTMKGVQLRNLHEKTGFSLTETESVMGFGFRHDSSVGNLAELLSHPFDHRIVPPLSSLGDRTVADMIAYMLSMSGEKKGMPASFSRPNGGTPVLYSHAAVGRQLTLRGPLQPDQALVLSEMIALVDEEEIGFIAKARIGGERRGFYFMGAGLWQSDRLSERLSAPEIMDLVAAGNEVTLMVVPKGSEVRLGVDRDEDGAFDRDEVLAKTDPADPSSRPRQVGARM